jgi:hypothetical protein
MRPTSFDPSALRQHLRRHKIADLPELKRILGTDTDLTVFPKLKQLQYLASYTHRGRFYTLPEIARFDHRGVWSHEGVWFSRHGTLLATLETFVYQSANGYYAQELAVALHAEVQQPLRHLVEQQRLARMEVDGQFLYTAIESVPRRQQLLARGSAQAVPVAVHSADLQASPHQLKAAILLFCHAAAENPDHKAGPDDSESRVFNVFCNGKSILANLNILEQAGDNRPLIRKSTGLQPNAQGKLLLEFVPVSRYATVTAIEVVPE